MNDQNPHTSLEEINEKLDRLLAYERARMIWGTVKTIIGIVIFVIFIILPIYFAYELLQNPFQYFDPNQFPELKKMIEEMIKQGFQ